MARRRWPVSRKTDRPTSMDRGDGRTKAQLRWRLGRNFVRRFAGPPTHREEPAVTAAAGTA